MVVDEGPLEVALLRGTGDAVLVSHGATHLEGELAVLTVDLDVGSAQPGRYYLGIRHPGANWTTSAIQFPISHRLKVVPHVGTMPYGLG
jgi:hypothetical protein